MTAPLARGRCSYTTTWDTINGPGATLSKYPQRRRRSCTSHERYLSCSFRSCSESSSRDAPPSGVSGPTGRTEGPCTPATTIVVIPLRMAARTRAPIRTTTFTATRRTEGRGCMGTSAVTVRCYPAHSARGALTASACMAASATVRELVGICRSAATTEPPSALPAIASTPCNFMDDRSMARAFPAGGYAAW